MGAGAKGQEPTENHVSLDDSKNDVFKKTILPERKVPSAHDTEALGFLPHTSDHKWSNDQRRVGERKGFPRTGARFVSLRVGLI